MRPTIDVSLVQHDAGFQKLDKLFGLTGRLNLYQNAKTDSDALSALNSMIGVLSGDSKEEAILQHDVGAAAGTALAARNYAKLTIQGQKPTIPFNGRSTPEHLILTLPTGS